MSLNRVLEPEVMDSPEEALAYDSMDHDEVNRRFVDDLLAAAESVELDSLTSPGAGAGSDSVQIEVLDLATGTAQIPVELCSRDERFRCLAIDLAESMLEIAGANVELAHLRDQIVLDRADAKSLPYDDGRFAVVFSNSLIHHLPDPAVGFSEAVRVTRPGGILFFRDLFRPADDEEVRRLVELYAGDQTEEQQRLLDDSLRAALTAAEVREIVSGLGFDAGTVAVTSDRHWTWSARKP